MKSSGYDIDSIKQKINSVEFVSFDVFDTLIHRTVQAPVDIFEMVPKYIKKNQKLLYLEHKQFLKDFKRKRIQAEENARQEHYKKYKNNEIILDDIYAYLLISNNVDIEFLNLLKQTEIELELDTVYPNLYNKELYDFAINANKKVIATTDMYLPTQVIGKILTKCGYTLPYEIFCSGELKCNKTEGDVFAHICEKFKIRPQDILHLGDNIVGDYHVPLKLSINTFHIDYKSIAQKQYKYKNEERNSTFTESLITGVVQKIKLSEASHDNEFYRLGYEVFGAIYTGYFIWLVNELKKKPVDKILFFARDAHFIRNIYLKYKELLDLNIPEEYVYISRASSLLASFTDFNVDRLWHLFGGRVKKTVEKGLANINIDHKEVEHEIEMTGFTNSSEFLRYPDSRFMSLLISIPDKIQTAASTRRTNLHQYIENVIEGYNKLAIVDIGWTGNMQGGFGRIARLINPKISISGYYFGTNGGLRATNLLPDNEYHGYLLNHGFPESLYNKLLWPGRIELLELALVAPHSTPHD